MRLIGILLSFLLIISGCYQQSQINDNTTKETKTQEKFDAVKIHAPVELHVDRGWVKLNGINFKLCLPKVMEGQIIEMKLVSSCADIQLENKNVVVGVPERTVSYTNFDTIFVDTSYHSIKKEDYIYYDPCVDVNLENLDIIPPSAYGKFNVKFRDNNGKLYESSIDLIQIGPGSKDCDYTKKHYGETCTTWILTQQFWLNDYFYNEGDYNFCINNKDIPNCLIDTSNGHLTKDSAIRYECFVNAISNALNYKDVKIYTDSAEADKHGTTIGNGEENFIY